MPRSQFISSSRLKPFIAYLALAFVIVLGLGAFVPRGEVRELLLVVWVVGFPTGAFLILRRD